MLTLAQCESLGLEPLTDSFYTYCPLFMDSSVIDHDLAGCSFVWLERIRTSMGTDPTQSYAAHLCHSVGLRYVWGGVQKHHIRGECRSNILVGRSLVLRYLSWYAWSADQATGRVTGPVEDQKLASAINAMRRRAMDVPQAPPMHHNLSHTDRIQHTALTHPLQAFPTHPIPSAQSSQTPSSPFPHSSPTGTNS